MKPEETVAASPLAFAPHEIIIQPNQSWLRLDWALLWEYRDLLGLLVHREFASKYKQTILGPAWFDPSAADDFAGVHGFLRPGGKDPDGWRAGCALLPLQPVELELSPAKYHDRRRDFHEQRRAVREGLLSPAGGADLRGALESLRLRASDVCFVVIYFGFLLLVPGTRWLHLTPSALLLPLLFSTQACSRWGCASGCPR